MDGRLCYTYFLQIIVGPPSILSISCFQHIDGSTTIISYLRHQHRRTSSDWTSSRLQDCKCIQHDLHYCNINPVCRSVVACKLMKLHNYYGTKIVFQKKCKENSAVNNNFNISCGILQNKTKQFTKECDFLL